MALEEIGKFNRLQTRRPIKLSALPVTPGVWALADSPTACDKEHIVRRPTMPGHVVVENMQTHKNQTVQTKQENRPLES